MSFDSSPESINKLTKFGMELASTDISYSDYQTKMIEKFYADADIEMINQMTEWASQPLMKLITVESLKSMVLKAMKKQFKKRADEMVQSQQQLTNYNNEVSQVTNATEIPIGGCDGRSHIQKYVLYISSNNAHTWPLFVKMIQSYLYLQETYSNYQDHVKFVDHIHSAWIETTRIRLITNQNILLRKVADLQSEVNQLKQKNADLSYQVQLTAYSLQLLQPVSPVYDYKEIKARKQILHSEFKRLSKLMRLG
jgi:hypothetical protein